MPRLPTILVMGSHAISTRLLLPVPLPEGIGIVEVMFFTCLEVGGYQVRLAPVRSSGPGRRHLGSWSSVWVVMPRNALMAEP